MTHSPPRIIHAGCSTLIIDSSVLTAAEVVANCDMTYRSLSLSDVEARCKEAAALKLPLSRLELSTEELQELFQVSNMLCLL